MATYRRLWLLTLTVAIAYAGGGDSDAGFEKDLGPVHFSPFGFVELIGTTRSATTHDDISTRFGSLPLQNTPGESLISLRNSRVALKADIQFGPGTLTGYYETDFLNRPPQEPYRFRQYFGEYSIGDWEFSAGQEWSLFRPSRAGITTIAQLMNTRVVDAGYQVGLLGYRDRQVRVLHHMGDWQAAVSFENGHDVLPKIAHDGKFLHWELTGIAGAAGHHGGSFAAVVHASPRMDIVMQQSWVRGGGKDALGTVPANVATSATLEGIEAKPGLGILVYGYAGLVYGARSPGNREVHEWTLGFSREIARDRIGPTVIGAQISQVDRAVWSGAHGAERFTMVSVRHYLNAPQ